MSGPQPGTAVRVRVPASSANLGPGFDSIGLALGVWDEYTVAVADSGGVRVEFAGDDQGVPADERHLVVATMRRAWELLGVDQPRDLVLNCANTIRQGRGMGSSAAAIVAGVAAAHGLALLAADPEGGAQPDLDAVNDLAGSLEGHPDNASASVYGGLTLSWVEGDEGGVPPRWDTPARIHSERVRLHPDVDAAVFVPTVQLPTATARAVLPDRVPHAEAALNSSRAALLVLALTARPDLLLPATRDWLHQEQRRSSLGGAMELVDRLRGAGHAAVVSGAGPSVLVLTRGEGEAAALGALTPPGWALLRPGVPTQGVHVDRVTLKTPTGEGAIGA